jgi:hypothetical protein
MIIHLHRIKAVPAYPEALSGPQNLDLGRRPFFNILHCIAMCGIQLRLFHSSSAAVKGFSLIAIKF